MNVAESLALAARLGNADELVRATRVAVEALGHAHEAALAAHNAARVSLEAHEDAVAKLAVLARVATAVIKSVVPSAPTTTIPTLFAPKKETH